jgi:transposase
MLKGRAKEMLSGENRGCASVNPAGFIKVGKREHIRRLLKFGELNSKNGNKYLGWAFVEAANFAMRCSPRIQQYYQRKQAETVSTRALRATTV